MKNGDKPPMFSIEESRIGIIGLGYVGLPLAVEFGKQFDTLGFDIDPVRINDLRGGVDRTMETTAKDLAEADRLTFTEDPKALRACNVFVVTVPTPIDRHKQSPKSSIMETSSSSKAPSTPVRRKKYAYRLSRLSLVSPITRTFS